MPRLVMKFGGTSVADLERIRNAAAKVKTEVERGYDVAVVVSAMSGKTNELVGWVRDASSPPGSNGRGLYDAREYDAVVASGEQVTSGLMALTLQEMGVPARSWQGWQVPVHTSDAHGAARIERIDTVKRRRAKLVEAQNDQKLATSISALVAETNSEVIEPVRPKKRFGKKPKSAERPQSSPRAMSQEIDLSDTRPRSKGTASSRPTSTDRPAKSSGRRPSAGARKPSAAPEVTLPQDFIRQHLNEDAFDDALDQAFESAEIDFTRRPPRRPGILSRLLSWTFRRDNAPKSEHERQEADQ